VAVEKPAAMYDFPALLVKTEQLSSASIQFATAKWQLSLDETFCISISGRSVGNKCIPAAAAL